MDGVFTLVGISWALHLSGLLGCLLTSVRTYWALHLSGTYKTRLPNPTAKRTRTSGQKQTTMGQRADKVGT